MAVRKTAKKPTKKKKPTSVAKEGLKADGKTLKKGFYYKKGGGIARAKPKQKK